MAAPRPPDAWSTSQASYSVTIYCIVCCCLLPMKHINRRCVQFGLFFGLKLSTPQTQVLS